MTEDFSLKEIVRTLAGEEGGSSARMANPKAQHMRTVMQSYIDNLNNYDPGFFSKTFSEDYKYEDPVGAGILGSEDMDKRYNPEFFTLTGAELISPISTSFGASAAMAFRVFAEVDGRGITIDIVDVMTFDDSGKIADVKAYWGADNVSLVP